MAQNQRYRNSQENLTFYQLRHLNITQQNIDPELTSDKLNIHLQQICTFFFWYHNQRTEQTHMYT